MNKDKWMRNTVVLFLMAVVCFPAVVMAATHIELKAIPTDIPTELDVIDNDSPCDPAEKGCIEVPHGSGHNMFFDLDNACKNGGPAYRLSAFRLSEEKKVWPTPEKPLKKPIIDDFNVDPTTGFIKWDSNDSTLKDDRIKLKNKNIRAYEVYYEITATECKGTGEIKLDPAIRNGGGGR